MLEHVYYTRYLFFYPVLLSDNHLLFWFVQVFFNMYIIHSNYRQDSKIGPEVIMPCRNWISFHFRVWCFSQTNCNCWSNADSKGQESKSWVERSKTLNLSSRPRVKSSVHFSKPSENKIRSWVISYIQQYGAVQRTKLWRCARSRLRTVSAFWHPGPRLCFLAFSCLILHICKMIILLVFLSSQLIKEQTT